MKRIFAVIGFIFLAVTLATAQSSTPAISAVYASGSTTPSYRWSFTITDTPANLTTEVPAYFSDVTAVATTDATIATAAQTAIMTKIASAEADAPSQTVTVTVRRTLNATAAVYTVVTNW